MKVGRLIFLGDVDEQRRLGQRAEELAAERVLVADVDRHAFARDFEGRLERGARSLIGEWNVKHAADEPTHDWLGRNSLAQRH